MERKWNMLVSFTKYTIFEEVIDQQYHYFKNCKTRLGFLTDEVYQAFSRKGYKWSAIEFPEELADKCMFTTSEYREEVKK